MEKIIEGFLKDRVVNYRDIQKDGVYIRLYINQFGNIGVSRYLAKSDAYSRLFLLTMETSWVIDLINFDRAGVVDYYIADLGVSCLLNGTLGNPDEEIDFNNTGFFKYSPELWQFIALRKENRRSLCELLYRRELGDTEFANIYDGWVQNIADERTSELKGLTSTQAQSLSEFEHALWTDGSILINKRKLQMNHYEFIEKHGPKFSEVLGIDNVATMAIAHGDKCYQYRDNWAKHQIPFGIGCLVYLLTYVSPYSETVRSTDSGFVPPCDWVIDQIKNNPKIKDAIEATTKENT